MNISKKLKIITICLLVILIFTNTNVFAQSINQIAAKIEQFKIFLNGEELSFKQPIVTINDKTYIPLREFAENYLDMKVDWNGMKETINLNGDIKKSDEKMISIFIYPASIVEGLAYRIDLSSDGQLSSTVGKMSGNKIQDENKNFILPKVTRYKSLTDIEIEEFTNLMSQITDDDMSSDWFAWDGWNVSVLYQGKICRYALTINQKSWLGSEHMFDIINKLIKYSPISIVTYNYQNWDESEYYENFDW